MTPPAAYPTLASRPAPARPRVLLVGTGFAAAASVMAFAGLIGIYLTLRADSIAATGAWLPGSVNLPLTSPNMAMLTLAMSVITMHWAGYSIGNDDRTNGYVALGLSILLALAYMNVTIFLLTETGASIRGTTPELLIFAVVGAHLLMATGASVFALLMAFRTLGGQYSGRDREGVAAATLYWDVMVVVYAVIWYAVYITK